MLLRAVRAAVRRLGLDARRISGSSWLVERRRSGRRPMRVREIGGGAWLVQRPRSRRRLVQLGPASLGSHLVVDERATRADMHRFQRSVAGYLAFEQIVWALDGLRINCVLDVGANEGQYAKGLRRAGYRGRIVSFEPVPHLVEQLRQASADDPDWSVRPCALGDEDGTTEINVSGRLSSLLPASDYGKQWSNKLRDLESETITVRRLDGLLDDCVSGLADPRVYLKLDTQGFDLQAFRGAGDRIGEVLGMQSEVSCLPIYEGMARLPEQIATYEAAGFEITGMFPVSRERRTQRVVEFDAIMVRASGFDA